MTADGVPFFELSGMHRAVQEDLLRSMDAVVRSGQFVGGAPVEAFEHEFAAYCGTAHCVGVSSGTDALRFALMACGVGEGDAVVTVANTFAGTVEAISQAGAQTEFVDVDPETCLMSAAALADYLAVCRTDPVTGRRLGRRSGRPLTAVVPVHLYGRVVDMDAVTEVSEHYGLTIVEDACQAHGAEYYSTRRTSGAWTRAGSFGRAAAFSFYPSKNLGACGEAGAVTTSDAGVARKVRLLSNHGQIERNVHEIEGYNGRLDALQAALLRIKLPHLDAWNAERRSAAAVYDRLLAQASPAAVPPETGLALPAAERGTSRPVYHLYVVRSNRRDALAAHLKGAGVQTAIHYPVPLHHHRCYRQWGQPGSLPCTERACAQVLSLPMFPGLTIEQQRQVADGIERFLAAGREACSAVVGRGR